jgi:hypothetical protein
LLFNSFSEGLKKLRVDHDRQLENRHGDALEKHVSVTASRRVEEADTPDGIPPDPVIDLSCLGGLPTLGVGDGEPECGFLILHEGGGR